MANECAPEGKMFVCLACGKISKWKYGFDQNGNLTDNQGKRYASIGYDESCMLNCELIETSKMHV